MDPYRNQRIAGPDEVVLVRAATHPQFGRVVELLVPSADSDDVVVVAVAPAVAMGIAADLMRTAMQSVARVQEN